MTLKQREDFTSVVKILAFVASVLFGAWQIEEHFVTRNEFNELRQDVRTIANSLKGDHARE